MTAPLKQDTTIVDVALENRAYDIVIGRDVLNDPNHRQPRMAAECLS